MAKLKPKKQEKAVKSKATSKKTVKASAKQGATMVKKLQAQVKSLKKKNSDLDDQYLRAEAEMQNVQKHAAADQAQLMKYSGQKLAKSILPGLDNMQRALQVKISDKNGQQLKQGVQMVYKRLLSALKDSDVHMVDVANKKFDPKFAQAVQTVPADKKHPAGQVVTVLQNGYRMHDRLLRPAMVVVAK